jgi:hypothetical protein
MDAAAFDPIFGDQLDALKRFISDENVLPIPKVRGRRLSMTVEGHRPDNRRDEFRLAIDGSGFPLYPYDIGFLDPSKAVKSWKPTDIKNPMWFPFDNETSFKTAFARSPSVFVCIQPGFSREYFVHHTQEQWNPQKWSLLEVVIQIRQALNAISYVQPNWERM